ncbi:MAG: sporulation protein [Candidatus Thorarchaeota archaeon]|nr:sporulation protein [Candidatus Thorarchaeota archaeon]
MRAVNIEFDNHRILPGDTLSGRVVVKTDKAFDCNRVVLKALSRERTEYGSGDNRSIDEECHMTRVFRLSESRTIPEGTTIIPFSFQLPRGLPPTYRRFSNFIRHTVEGVVEVDWALDPKFTQEFHVLQTRPPHLSDDVGVETATKSDEGLHIQSSGILRMDTGILVGFKVDEEKRMRRVRFDIVKREDAKCRWHETSSKKTMRQKYFELERDDWGRWKEIQFGEEWRFHLPFKSSLIRVSYYLKVTLEIGLRLDPSIEIPLRFSDFAPDIDVLNDIAYGLGLDDW